MSTDSPIAQQLDAFGKDFEAMRREIGKVIVGQNDVVEGVLTAIVAGGHVLLEGVPGLGKTRLVESLADVLDVSFQRIPFTPDLMPSDLIGTFVVMETPQGRRTFEFQKGPLFSNVVLADQLNRGTPKTQSALLEAMEGDVITVSNESFELPKPFFVMATQNPMEMEGTFPLPEPQLDRFLLKFALASPTEPQIEEILKRTTGAEPPLAATIVDAGRIVEMRALARRVAVNDGVRRAAASLVAASHPDHPKAPPSVKRYVRYGASPRGAAALVLASQVRALAAGRKGVAADDLRALGQAALGHRLILNIEGQAEDVQPSTLVDDLLQTVLGHPADSPAPAAE